MWNVLQDSPIYPTIPANCCYAKYHVRFSRILLLFAWCTECYLIFLKEDLWQVSMLIDNSLCLNKSVIFKMSYIFWLTCHHWWLKKEDFQCLMAVCRSLCVTCRPHHPLPTSFHIMTLHQIGMFHININEMPKIFNAWTSTVHVWSASLLCLFFFFFFNPITVGYGFSIRQLK